VRHSWGVRMGRAARGKAAASRLTMQAAPARTALKYGMASWRSFRLASIA